MQKVTWLGGVLLACACSARASTGGGGFDDAAAETSVGDGGGGDATGDGATVDTPAADVPPGDAPALDTTTPDAQGLDVATPDVATPDVAPPDVAAPDVAAPDVSAPATCATLEVLDLPRTGTTSTARGDTTAAWTAQTGGSPTSGSPRIRVSPTATCPLTTGQVVYRYTVGPQTAALQVTTSNPGTAPNFDTALYVTTRCAASLSSLMCNDDDPRSGGSPDRRVSSYVVTGALPAGTQVFIVLGGYFPPADTGVTVDHGAYELSVTEVAVTAPGTQGGACRGSAPACDAGLVCSSAMAGVCQRVGVVDGPCDPLTACPAGAYCDPASLGAAVGTCRRVGSLPGAPCRSAGAPNGRCDSALTCSADLDLADPAPTCRARATGACDVFRTICPAGSTCVTANAGAITGSCVTDGAALRARCRAASPRCDSALGAECVTVGEGAAAAELCMRRVTTGARCGATALCPGGDTCFLDDVTNRYDGRCGREGQAGGACREAGARCDVTLSCSAASGPGVCSAVVTTRGAPCDLLRNRCGTGLSCVRTAADLTAGTCQPDGLAAGAACRVGAAPCDTGLACVGSALSGGACARTSAAGGACDPVLATAVCPAGQSCLARSVTTGTCVSAVVTSAEPDDSPALAAARPHGEQSLVRGTLERFDVDCHAFTVTTSGRPVVVVSDGNGRCPVNPGGRLALTLYDADRATVRLLASNNGPFGAGACAHIDGARTALYPALLQPGTYTVCVRGVQDATTFTDRVDYTLSFSVTR